MRYKECLASRISSQFLRGGSALSSQANFWGGGRQIAEKRIARSRPRKRGVTKQTSNKQRCERRFNFI
jgi:hypothetical protein